MFNWLLLIRNYYLFGLLLLDDMFKRNRKIILLYSVLNFNVLPNTYTAIHAINRICITTNKP